MFPVFRGMTLAEHNGVRAKPKALWGKKKERRSERIPACKRVCSEAQPVPRH